MDYLGTADYLTSPMTGKIESWTHYNEWGEITHNAVLKCGQRELDMVKRYATHDYDSVLGMYYAKARFYDAEDRRFTAIDPILDGSVYDITDYATNPVQFVQYLYVKNNPVIYIDPDGLRPVIDDLDPYGAYSEKSFDYRYYRQEHKDMFIEGIVSSATVPVHGFDLSQVRDYNKKIKKCDDNYGEETADPIPSKIDLNDPAYFLIINSAEEHAGIFPEGFDKLTLQQRAVALKTYGEYFKDNEIAKQVYIQAGINLVGMGLDLYFARGVPKGTSKIIKTPYGDAIQDMSEEALKLKDSINEEGYVYRAGQFGRSNTTDAQFWAPENPLNPGYAEKYGVDFKNIDYIIRGKIKTGTDFITRPAPGLGSNAGGALEIVTNPYDVIIDFFIMP
ncbi:MAG: RHS repeat-associated core domain-containing protein [Sedimentibacter saalensis]|jgi:RHS repeat-associated protein|nr:RHS repeat-associated core domain-containing protein [Sedimentibacter saalensis]MEA5095216.1 RHS repeat-associated core domain-containing protein [Sedimentibacter saalensis]